MPMRSIPCVKSTRDSIRDVFLIFLRLGLTCFGGPVAHIAYFRDEFVTRRQWLDEKAYADLVGLCQFLPGPASSQVGFALGLSRAGYLGGLAAWTGFTLPSAIALVIFAISAPALKGAIGIGLLHGLRLVAVAVVAQAVWSMARAHARHLQAMAIALVAALICVLVPSSISQIGAIVFGGIAGALLCRHILEEGSGAVEIPVSRKTGLTAIIGYFGLLVIIPLFAKLFASGPLLLLAAFYRSGALVFGGGHVVLPLLHDAFVKPGWISESSFLSGYGAAQAVPGPLFTFAAFLGTAVTISPHGIVGAALGLFGIFLPGILILVGALPFWNEFRSRSSMRAAMLGINAAVVGLLGAALYKPIWISTVTTAGDLAIVLIGFALLTVWRVPPLAIVIAGALSGIAESLL